MELEDWIGEKEVYAVAGVTVMALGLRLVNIGAPLWQDEGLYIYASQHLSGLLGTYFSGATMLAHPPLYLYLLGRVSGLPWKTEAVFRSVSVLAGTLTVPVVYFIGKQVYDEALGFLAALLLAFSTNHIIFSQDVHPGALAVFLSSLSVLLWLRFFDARPSEEDLMKPAFVSFLSLLTHFANYFLLLFLPFQYIISGEWSEWRDVLVYVLLGLSGMSVVLFVLGYTFTSSPFVEVLSRPEEAGSLLSGGLLGLFNMVQVFLGASLHQLVDKTLQMVDIYWGSSYLYLPIALLAVPLISRDNCSGGLYAWLVSVFSVVLGLSALMLSMGQNPGRLYPVLIPPVVLINARAVMILVERWKPLLLVAVILFSALFIHFPQVYGHWDGNDIDFAGGWYPHRNDVKWAFDDAGIVYSADGPGPTLLEFQGRSYNSTRTVTVETPTRSENITLTPEMSSYRINFTSKEGENRVSFIDRERCVMPRENFTWEGCASFGIKDMGLFQGNKTYSTAEGCKIDLMCLKHNPAGYNPEKEWWKVADRLSGTDAQVFTRNPEIVSYYSGGGTGELHSLRFEPLGIGPDLESSLGKVDTVVVTDFPYLHRRLASSERDYLTRNCSLDYVGEILMFHCMETG